MSHNLGLDKKDLEKYAIFLFGVIFLAVILTIVLLIPTPTLTQFFTFRLILALAAGGVGALIPGFIQFEHVLSHGPLVRGGGAVAFAATVWFSNPAQFAIKSIEDPPAFDAGPYMAEYIVALDMENHSLSYALLSKLDRASISAVAYSQLITNARKPLGKRIAGPFLQNTATASQLNGRNGPFIFNAYQSTFAKKLGVWLEIAGVVAEEGKWKMHSYTIQPCLPPMCLPLEQFISLQATNQETPPK